MPCTRLTLETEIRLLDFFRDNPCLWHSKHSDYSNKKVRNAKLNEAAQLISVASGKDAYEKFRNLRTTYYRELKRTTEMEGHKSKWRHFTRMSFLRQSMSEIDNEDPHNDDSLVSDRSGHGEIELSVVANHSLNSNLASAGSIPNDLGQPTHVQSIITPLNTSQVLYTVNSDKVAIANVDGTAAAQLSALPGQLMSSNIVNTRILQPHASVGQRIASPVILSRTALPNGVATAPTIVNVSSPKGKNVGTALGTSQLITMNSTGQFYSVVTESPTSCTATQLVGTKRAQSEMNALQNPISTQKALQISSSIGSGSSAKRAKPATLPPRPPMALLHSPTLSQQNVSTVSVVPSTGTVVSPSVAGVGCVTSLTAPPPSVTNLDGTFVKKTDLNAIIKTEFQKLLSEDSDLLFALSITQSLKNLRATARESLKLAIQKCVLDITIQNSNQAQSNASTVSLQVSQSVPSASSHAISYQVPGQVQVQVSNGLNISSSDINGHKSVNGHSNDGQTQCLPQICVVSGTVLTEQTNGPESPKNLQDSSTIVCVNADSLRTTPTAIASVQSDSGKNERH